MLRLITPTTLQSRLNLSRAEIQQLVAKNEIPFVSLPGGGVRFDLAAIENWILSKANEITSGEIGRHEAGSVEPVERRCLRMLRIDAADSSGTAVDLL